MIDATHSAIPVDKYGMIEAHSFFGNSRTYMSEVSDAHTTIPYKNTLCKSLKLAPKTITETWYMSW